jgi:hypothetical protein
MDTERTDKRSFFTNFVESAPNCLFRAYPCPISNEESAIYILNFWTAV